MKKIYVSLFVSAIIFFLNSPIFSQSPACASFSGVFISDSLEQNLADYTICNGSSIYLKSLNNPATATFQWKKNGVNISGETNRKINVNSEGIYSLTMTVGACMATSSGIIVRQYTSGGYHPYQISSNYITQACTGDSIKLSTPKGFGITYQWKKDGVNISGVNAPSYKAITTGIYSLVATQGTCNFTSNSVFLNFSNSANPQIFTDKSVICQGRKTTLKSYNINATHTLQWFKDGIAISAANKDSLVVNQTGNYYLQTTKGSCTGNSYSLNISITNLNLPSPQIQKEYSNAFETCANNVVKLSVKDYNDTTVVWLKDGNVLIGQTGTTLIARESGNYAVRYSGNELCFSQSDVVAVKITDIATMSFAGNNFTVGSGQQAKINYTFNGVAPIVLNVNNVYNTIVLNPSGSNYYDYPTATTTYSATNFANACGVGTFSNPATITVATCSPATQITSISSTYATVCIGGSTTINVTANGTNYQWQKDGVDISGATSNNLNISNFNYSNIGDYRLKVTGTCGTITSDNIRVNANYGDVVFAKLDYPAYTNSDILLTAFSGSSFGNASNAYRWAGPNGFTSTEQNPVIPNGTALNSGTYTVTATNAGGCVNYALLSVTVTTAPITLGNLGTTSFCPNGTLSVPFTTTLAIGTLYKVYLSDANGSFRNQTEIGNGMTSPITVTFPQYGVNAGTRYRIKIVSTSPSATSSLSGYLSTDGQVLTISVKNLVGSLREIEAYSYVCQGSALTAVISSSQSGVTFNWKKDGVNQASVPALRMTQTGVYRATVAKTGCSSLSRDMNIFFNPIIQHYASFAGNGYQCAGESVLFQDTYFSDSATYQWKRDGNILIGKTKDTLIVSQSGTYKTNIVDKCPIEDQTQFPVNNKVIFSNSIANNPSFIWNQNALKLCGNNAYHLLYGGASDNNPLSPYYYQWRKNGVDISGKTNKDISINTEGIYSLALKQGNCITVSKGISIVKMDTIKLKLQMEKNSSNFICQGMQTVLNGTELGGTSVSLFKDGIFNQTLYSYDFGETYAFISETGNYHIAGSTPGCVILPSDTIKISVGNILKPIITSAGLIKCIGTGTGLFNSSSMLSNAQYQWFKNGTPIPAQISGYLRVTEAGHYQMRVTSGACTGFSDSVEVKVVTSLPQPKIYDFNLNGANIKASTGGFLCNNSVSYLHGFNFSTALYDSLFWKKNDNIYKITLGEGSLPVTESGIYTLIVKQGTCLSPESDPVEIKIGEPITANITGSTSIYPGQKAKLNLNFTGGNAWSYQTSDVATGQTTSLSPTLKNVNPASTQTYSITSVASNCGVGTVTGDATVTVLPCPTDKTISLNSGNWNTATTWTCGQIPTAAYDAIIENAHTVTLPNGYQGITKKLDLRGGLKQGVGAGVRVSN